MDLLLAKRAWQALEAIHAMIYFVPEADQEYRAIGLQEHATGYFASRAAALGPVAAEVVIATFYNFNPSLVRQAIPSAWEQAAPATIIEARLRAADCALRRAWPTGVLISPALEEVATLARRAVESTADDLAGRPLFAAYSTLSWPEAPHMVLWHALTLLREYRGDGHIAALVVAGLDPLEALVTHVATGDVSAEGVRRSRGWSRQEWDAAVARLVHRGYLEGENLEGAELRGSNLEAGRPLVLTHEGRTVRQLVEDDTTRLGKRPYEAIGEEATRRLLQIGKPLADVVISAGLLKSDQQPFAAHLWQRQRQESEDR